MVLLVVNLLWWHRMVMRLLGVGMVVMMGGHHVLLVWVVMLKSLVGLLVMLLGRLL
jgi:hypothetical protein